MTPTDWLLSGDTGISSETIFRVMVGSTAPVAWGKADIPYDPSDFGRCYRLLQLFPEWRNRLPEVANRFPDWEPFVKEWDSLTALYEEELAEGTGKAPRLYEKMLEIRNGLRIKAVTKRRDDAQAALRHFLEYESPSGPNSIRCESRKRLDELMREFTKWDNELTRLQAGKQ